MSPVIMSMLLQRTARGNPCCPEPHNLVPLRPRHYPCPADRPPATGPPLPNTDFSYSLTVTPGEHFINWQQDPFSNYLGRLVFPEKTTEFQVEVDLVAEMIVINPFDFFLEPDAETFPFVYEAALKIDLGPYLVREAAGEQLSAYLQRIDRSPKRTIDFLVDLNLQLSREIGYLIRMEPNVQSCEQTLTLGSGSCRDSAWLLVNILRHLGLAARFVSGYLIQLKADVKSLDGPSGAGAGFHRSPCLDRGLSPRCRLGGHGSDLRTVCRRGAYPAGLFTGTAERSPDHRHP